MGKIISFIHPKGGVGKSTCTICISSWFFREGKNVLLIDADPTQQTLRRWDEDAKDIDHPKVLILDKQISYKESCLIKEKFDYVFFDSGATTNEMLANVLTISDMAIIPVQPSGLDYRNKSTENFMDMISITKKQRIIPVYFLINRDKPRTVLSKKIEEKLLKQFGLPILKHHINDSIKYPETIEEGEVIFDKKNERFLTLADEIALVSKEIKEKLYEQ